MEGANNNITSTRISKSCCSFSPVKPRVAAAFGGIYMWERFSALAERSEFLLYYPACDEFYVELIYLLAV